MARPRDANLDDLLRRHLAAVEALGASGGRITIAGVARAVRRTRQTLYSRGLVPEILAAAQRQLRARQQRGREVDHLAALHQRLRDAEERNRALIYERAVIEYNALRLGVDPEQLREPIPKADRAVSRAGARGSRKRRG